MNGSRRFDATLPAPALSLIPAGSAESVLAAADEILDGRWRVLGIARRDLKAPDWFFDPVTGRRAPQGAYCFGIDYRAESVTGNVKQIWELSRLQHVSLLASAYSLSGAGRYAQAAARHLESWWDENHVLAGVHWTSGIEVALRLISWAWTRRLLEGWPGASRLFEQNDRALAQIWWHQRYLAAYQSRGSSANNHAIAEASGQLIGALAFPWFAQSRRWADKAAWLLQRELARNTLVDGINREMAFDYHGFVAELGLAAAAEADRAGRPLDHDTWVLLCKMVDALAANLDERLRAPRYGDGDDGRGFLLGSPGHNRWSTLLSIGRTLFGALDWWPPCTPDPASALLSALAEPRAVAGRPSARPAVFADAGITILRGHSSDGSEVWCRCDGGPHGFLSIAAHAHADALSIELRHGGVDIFADPGTYCYHGEKQWRRYFRSTLAHNTVELGRTDQSISGGSFLWTRHARTRTLGSRTDPALDVSVWSAEHYGYKSLDPPAVHRRTVTLSQGGHVLEILDEIRTEGDHPYRLAFHMGPDVDTQVRDLVVELSWTTPREGRPASARLLLPEGPHWRSVRGSADPVLGWYSPGFGEKVPSTTILGEGRCGAPRRALRTVVEFDR